jgi:hypothetical protein
MLSIKRCKHLLGGAHPAVMGAVCGRKIMPMGRFAGEEDPIRPWLRKPAARVRLPRQGAAICTAYPIQTAPGGCRQRFEFRTDVRSHQLHELLNRKAEAGNHALVGNDLGAVATEIASITGQLNGRM